MIKNKENWTLKCFKLQKIIWKIQKEIRVLQFEILEIGVEVFPTSQAIFLD